MATFFAAGFLALAGAAFAGLALEAGLERGAAFLAVLADAFGFRVVGMRSASVQV